MSTAAPTQANEEAERTARHIRLVREMGELAAGLARAVAARAERDLAAASDPPQPAETAKPVFSNTSVALLHFTRLCKILENALALEARLAKGLTPIIPKTRPAPSPAAAPANPPSRAPLSPTAASLMAGTSLSTPIITPPWQPKPSLNGTTPA